MVEHRALRVLWRTGILALVCATSSVGAVSLEQFDSDASDTVSKGWSGAWSTTADLSQAATLKLEPGSLPTPSGFTPPSAAGRLAGFTGLIFRGLSDRQVFALDEASEWYIRLVVRRSAVENSKGSSGASLLLNDRLDRLLTIGCASSGKLTIQGPVISQTPKPAMALGHAYVWLIRLDRPDADGKRVIRIRLFHESNAMPSDDPRQWSLVSKPMPVSGTIDRIGFAAGRNARIELDEIRIGRTWEDLTGQ